MKNSPKSPLLALFLNVSLVLAFLFFAGLYLAAFPLPLGWKNHSVTFLLFALPLAYLLYWYLPVYFAPSGKVTTVVNGVWLIYFLAYMTFITTSELQNYTYKRGYRVATGTAREFTTRTNCIYLGFSDELSPRAECSEIRVIKGKVTRREYLTPLLWP